MFDWSEIGRGKQDEKQHFPPFGSGEKTRETKNREENNLFGPTFFHPPNLGGKWGGKDVDNVIYKNTFTLLHSPTPLTFPLLYKNDIIVNLYKLHFSSSSFSLQPNKKIFHPSNQTHMRENQIFSVFPLFHPPTNFSSFHFSTPPTKRILIVYLVGVKTGRMENRERKIG